MKIKSTILTCLLIAMASTQILSESAQLTSPIYLPILNYQKALSQMVSNYIMSMLYAKNKKDKASHHHHHQEEVKVTTPQLITENDIPKIDRQEALEKMKTVSTKLFDLSDTDTLSAHLLALKELSNNLDPEIDKKAITAIHFLNENQHRTNDSDIMFWLYANNKYGLESAIPVTEQVKNKPRSEKLGTLQKKMVLQAQLKNNAALAAA